MIARSLLVCIVLCSAVSLSFGQNLSIADLARQERARQQALARPSAPILDGTVSPKQALLNQTLAVCDIRRHLVAMLTGPDVSAAVGVSKLQIPETVRQGIQRAVSEAMHPQRSMPQIERYLAGLDAAVLNANVQWCRSPLGIRTIQAESELPGPGKKAHIEQFMKTLERTPPSARRVQLLAQLAGLTKGAEHALDMIVAFVKGLESGAVSAGVPLSAVLAPEQERTFRNQFLREVAESMRANNLYEYRTLSDADLVDYIAFLRTRAFMSLYETTGQALIAVFADAGRYVGEKLPEIARDAK